VELAWSAFWRTSAPGWLAPVLLVALTVCVALLLRALHRRERALGRFNPFSRELLGLDSLQEALLPLRPEVAGAIWHQSVGTAEVAALLTRLLLERKLQGRAEPSLLRRAPRLHLTLPANRSSLSGYERALIDALFEGDAVDPASLRQRYPDGFIPADLIGPSLRQEASRIAQAPPAGLGRWLPCLVLALVPLTLPFSTGQGQAAGILALALGAMAHLLARRYRRAPIVHPASLVVPFLPLVALAIAWSWLDLTERLRPDLGLQSGLFAFLAGASCWTAQAMRSPHTPDGVRLRRVMAAARRRFQKELDSPRPALDDGCTAHLVALDLGADVGRWYRQHREGGSDAPRGTWGLFGQSGPLLEIGPGWFKAVWSFAKGVAKPEDVGTG
jgi:hypothetical protein